MRANFNTCTILLFARIKYLLDWCLLKFYIASKFTIFFAVCGVILKEEGLVLCGDNQNKWREIMAFSLASARLSRIGGMLFLQ